MIHFRSCNSKSISNLEIHFELHVLKYIIYLRLVFFFLFLFDSCIIDVNFFNWENKVNSWMLQLCGHE